MALSLTVHYKSPIHARIDQWESRHSCGHFSCSKIITGGHFSPGSMQPKIEAAIHFLERGGREVIITTPEKAVDAFEGEAGTHVFPDEGSKEREKASCAEG